MSANECRQRVAAAMDLLDVVRRIRWDEDDAKFLYGIATKLEAEAQLIEAELEAMR